MSWQSIEGVITQGHQVASGLGVDSPYPESTIKMQKPFFQKLGLDLSSFYDGTLNFSIEPATFKLVKPQYTFPHLEWTDKHPPETFSFSACRLVLNNEKYNCFVYYPHPETKERHFQSRSVIEIIAPFIPNLHYGSKVILEYNTNEVIID